jgi:uncharacterized protein YbcV (DUF1398 family)
MNTKTIVHCMALSFADTAFPTVVRDLIGAGVESYRADLIALRNTYHDNGEESFDEPLPLVGAPAVAEDFNQPSVAVSVAAIQHGEIGYAEFLRRIMRAGCAHYDVFIGGRKVMYVGRRGEVHTEVLPAARD